MSGWRLEYCAEHSTKAGGAVCNIETDLDTGDSRHTRTDEKTLAVYPKWPPVPSEIRHGIADAPLLSRLEGLESDVRLALLGIREAVDRLAAVEAALDREGIGKGTAQAALEARVQQVEREALQRFRDLQGAVEKDRGRMMAVAEVVETEALEKRLNVLEARTAALEKALAEERSRREARPRQAEERLSNLESELERERTERSTAQLRLSKVVRMPETEEWDRRVNELETRAGDLERQLVHERDERVQATRKAMRSIQTVAELAGKR